MTYLNRTISKFQEKQTARRYNGKVQPGSGASHRAKGDVRVEGEFRFENKFTTKNSFPLSPRLLEKLRKECQGGETPVLQIEFRHEDGVHPFIVLREKDFIGLLQEIKCLQEDVKK